MQGAQLGLFDREPPRFDPAFRGLRRVTLDRGAWIDHVPGWVSGHQALFDELSQTVSWQAGEELIYDRVLATPRLYATWPEDSPPHPRFDMRASVRLR